jgi:dTDP-N-acetylfucosamine:lipid II N-acetylfucosaminyltransferase
MKILHIAEPQTFTKPFFSLIEKNFEVKDHAILTRGKSNGWSSELEIANKTLTGFAWASAFLNSSRKAEKIILHGLWDFKLVVLLALHPSILAKCYWMIWGGDLYSHSMGKKSLKWYISEFFRRPVIRRMGHLVTYVQGDAELAREWYGAIGEFHECIMYTSNIYQDYEAKAQFYDTVNIQIGNSADPSNNHLDILEKLKPFQDKNIAIYAPLSYGDQVHAKKVIDAGKAIFGDKFKPITDFMAFDQYLDFLGKIDIAVFNHKRQQAMGNTITLLGLGKKVYMRTEITPWTMFEMLQVKVFDIDALNLDNITEEVKRNNSQRIKCRFSEFSLLSEFKLIFEG